MNNPKNYELEPAHINCSNGAKCGQTYLPPATDKETKKYLNNLHENSDL